MDKMLLECKVSCVRSSLNGRVGGPGRASVRGSTMVVVEWVAASCAAFRERSSARMLEQYDSMRCRRSRDGSRVLSEEVAASGGRERPEAMASERNAEAVEV